MRNKRNDQEFANQVIQYFTGEGNNSKKITVRHFSKQFGKDRSTIHRIIRRYEERGTTVYRKQTGKPRTQSTEENLNKLREIFRNDPNTSLRQASKILGVSMETASKMRMWLREAGRLSLTATGNQLQEFEKPPSQLEVGALLNTTSDPCQSSPLDPSSVPNSDLQIASDPPSNTDLLAGKINPPKLEVLDYHPPSPPAPAPIAVKKEVSASNENDARVEDFDDAFYSSYFDDDDVGAPSPVDLEHASDNGQRVKVKQAKSGTVTPPPTKRKKCGKQVSTKEEEEESSVDYNSCLLCHQKMKKNQTPVLTSDIVDANFNAMFILQKMLGLPKSKLAECLESVEEPPGEWVVFCRKCLKLVDEAINIQKEISDLEEKLRGCQRRIFQEIKTSCREDLKQQKELESKKRGRKKKMPLEKPKVVQVTEDIRRFINFRESEENEELEVFSQGSSGISQKRRRMKRKSMREDSLSPVDFCDREPSPPPSPHDAASDPDLDVKPGPKSVSLKKNKPTDDTGTDALTTGGYSCSSCPNLETMNLGTLINHGLFHFRRPLKCYQCGLHFSSSSELKENPFAKKPDSTHICSSETLVQTIFDPGNIWKCSFCPQKFTSDIDRDSHEETHHPTMLLKIDLPHKCISCSKQFRSLAERLLHRVLEHPEVASLSCLFCEDTFSLQTFDGVQISDISKVNDHIRKEHDWFPNKRLPEECDFCGTILWSSTNLQTHMEKAHGLSKTFSYSCSICHTRRIHRPLVTRHMVRVHLLDDPLSQLSETQSCQVCGYKTAKDIMLLEHKLTKHGLEPEDGRRVYICTKVGCEFRTLMDISFSKHLMKDHEERRKYICRFCGKEFLKWNYRRLHEQIHLNKELRPYQCEMCGKSYAVKTYLYIHKRITHQKRPFGRTIPKKGKLPRIIGTPSVRIKGGGMDSYMEPHVSSGHQQISSDKHGYACSSGISMHPSYFMDNNMFNS